MILQNLAASQKFLLFFLCKSLLNSYVCWNCSTTGVSKQNQPPTAKTLAASIRPECIIHGHEIKKKMIVFLGILVILGLVLFMSYDTITQRTADWEFIQKVGGINIGTPLQTQDGYYLQVKCNVSGTDSITVKPTTLNSAYFCTKINTQISDNKIYLKVMYGIATLSRDCNCKAVNLGKLNAGEFQVYFKDNSSKEHLIGQFTIH